MAAHRVARTVHAESTELPVYSRLPLEPIRGEGCYLYDARGEAYLDFYGAHAVALTGHCHPHVVAAIREQAQQLVFYSSAVHSPVREAAGRLLLEHAPHPGSRLFHCCSGAEATEVAFKLARKATGRRMIVSFTGSFHGRTLAALSACGIDRYRATAGPVLAPDHRHVPFGDVDALAAAVDDTTAAVIVETIQSLGGVHAPPDGYYREVASLAADRGALLVFDEIQTGLGRTGKFFFADRVGVKPDLITLAKGLASGVPAAAVVVAPSVVQTVRSGDHGSTFGGGPVAMAAMRATLEVIEREGLVENAARMGTLLRDAVSGLRHVVQVRGRGLLIGIQLGRPAQGVVDELLRRRVIAGTSAEPDVLRLLPPLIIGEPEVEAFVRALRLALEAA